MTAAIIKSYKEFSTSKTTPGLWRATICRIRVQFLAKSFLFSTLRLVVWPTLGSYSVGKETRHMAIPPDLYTLSQSDD